MHFFPLSPLLNADRTPRVLSRVTVQRLPEKVTRQLGDRRMGFMVRLPGCVRGVLATLFAGQWMKVIFPECEAMCGWIASALLSII